MLNVLVGVTHISVQLDMLLPSCAGVDGDKTCNGSLPGQPSYYATLAAVRFVLMPCWIVPLASLALHPLSGADVREPSTSYQTSCVPAGMGQWPQGLPCPLERHRILSLRYRYHLQLRSVACVVARSLGARVTSLIFFSVPPTSSTTS